MDTLTTPKTLVINGVTFDLVATDLTTLPAPKMISLEQFQLYVQIGTAIYQLAVAAYHDIKAAFGQTVSDEVLAALDIEYDRRIHLTDPVGPADPSA